MDLGIRGKTAVVCAASKGLGRGCAEALAEAGVDLVINARGVEALQAAAAEISGNYGVSVTAVAADITTEGGRAKVLAANPSPDILVNNAGGPPPGMGTVATMAASMILPCSSTSRAGVGIAAESANTSSVAPQRT